MNTRENSAPSTPSTIQITKTTEFNEYTTDSKNETINGQIEKIKPKMGNQNQRSSDNTPKKVNATALTRKTTGSSSIQKNH